MISTQSQEIDALGESLNELLKKYVPVKFYKKLLQKYNDTKTCISTMRNDFKNSFVSKIRQAAEIDGGSKLGTYLSINPKLLKQSFEDKFEFQRVCITRYRTGSHNLRIEKDRWLPNSNREDRICTCNTGIQNIQHVLLHCPLLLDIRKNME